MGSFSERYGYVKVSDALIVEKITPEIINAIYNCYKMYTKVSQVMAHLHNLT